MRAVVLVMLFNQYWTGLLDHQCGQEQDEEQFGTSRHREQVILAHSMLEWRDPRKQTVLSPSCAFVECYSSSVLRSSLSASLTSEVSLNSKATLFSSFG